MNDYKIPDTDVLIENVTTVFLSPFTIQRDPEYYPDPDKLKKIIEIE